jgi:hypothetical protein
MEGQVMMTNKKTRRKNRAIALGLADALRMVEQIHRQGGGGGVPRNSLESIIDSKPTSSLYDRKLAALKSYGLIETQPDMISLSPIGKAYATPISPESKKQSALQAFRNIPLFDGLLSRFEGKPLPAINEFFHNLVAEAYSVPHEEVSKWIREFIDGAKFTDILVTVDGQEVVRLPGSVGAPSPKPQGGATAMELEELQEQSGELVGLKIHGAKTQMNIPDKVDEKLLIETIGATEDALEHLRRKLARLTGNKYTPIMTVYIPKDENQN